MEYIVLEEYCKELYHRFHSLRIRRLVHFVVTAKACEWPRTGLSSDMKKKNIQNVLNLLLVLITK